MTFHPEHPPIPETLRTETFLLRPLRATDVELDYDAVMESREMLRRWSGSDWPSDDFALQDNLGDLEYHEGMHLERKEFTFTVMNPDETECLGCVYITPLKNLLRRGNINPEELAPIKEDEATVRFWARQSRLADGLDEKLLETLEAWFPREWAFSRVTFRTNARDERQVELLTQRNHPLLFTLELPRSAGPFLIYG
jgi:hypothetical protein